MKSLLIAFQFLTRIPVGRTIEASHAEFRRAVAFLPIVGLVLGSIVAGLDWAVQKVLPINVSSAVAIVTLVSLTGALHLDGLGDFCDGVFGGGTRERALKIMKDIHIGVFGVVGICCALLLKYVSLAALVGSYRWRILIVVPVLSRWIAVVTITFFPYARSEQGLGSLFKQTGKLPFLLATAMTVGITLVIANVLGVWLLLGMGITVSVCALQVNRFLGGLTGDCYGAFIELAEVIGLVIATIITSKTLL